MSRVIVASDEVFDAQVPLVVVGERIEYSARANAIKARVPG